MYLRILKPLWESGGLRQEYILRILMGIVKGDWNGVVSQNNREKVGPVRCLDGHVKEPYEVSMVLEPDCRSKFFLSLPAHLYVITYMYITEIFLHVMLSNQSHFHSRILEYAIN